MLLYIIIFCLLLLLAINNKLSNSKLCPRIIVLILGLFLCTGYMTGSDWRGYELDYYESVSFESCFEKPGEVFFYFVCWFFNSLGVDFWHFWIVLKLLCFFTTIGIISKYSGRKQWWIILFFYSYFGLFYYIDNPMRNLIASIIILSGIKVFVGGSYKHKLTYILCASCFHMSTLIVTPFLLIAPKVKLSTRKMVLILLCLFIGAMIFWTTDLFKIITQLSGVIDHRGAFYLESEDTDGGFNLSIGTIFQILLFFFALYISKKSKKKSLEHDTDKLSLFILNSAFFYVCTLPIESAIPILGRISMFLFFPFLLFIVTNVFFQRKKSPLIMGLVVVFLFVVLFKNITSSFRYIPYTSYLQYIYKKKPNYDSRSEYNYYKSPYTKRQ